jgi:flagellar basal-body rod protein FlgB
MINGRMTMSEELGINGRLFDRTMGILGRVLDYRARNQRVIASNVANIDTPGFRPKRLKFDEELRKAVEEEQVHLTRTDGKHLPGPQQFSMAGEQSFELETEPEGIGGDHSLDIDREMAKMAKNNLLYNATVKMLSKKFSLLKEAIEGGR